MRNRLLLLKSIAFAICCLFGAALPAQMSKSETKAMLRMLQVAPDFAAVIDSLSRWDLRPDAAQIPDVRAALWNKMLYDGAQQAQRHRDFELGLCTYGDAKIGKFAWSTVGARPDNGYPVYIALHGGGGGPQEMNDEQWQQMQRYYLSSIDTGIYVAPRGPNNTWNLHFDDDAQAFYGQLLRDLRLYGNVDPDRIYLLGYSAGGDGVYQLAPRFASQLAAASMSAGHHNGVPADNLMHVPMLLQVGELDDAYDRNKETVRYGMILDSLQKRFLGEFVHQVYVHAQAEHSYVLDRRGPTFLANVCADPIAWLHGAKAAATRQAITDAPTWLAHHRRDPYPRYLRWDTGTRTAGGNDFYWISVEQPADGQSVEVWANPQDAAHPTRQNEIIAAAFKGTLDIHLHEKLFNPQQAVTIKVAGQTFVVPPKPSMLAMAVGMARTGDPAFAFYQTVRIVGDGQKHYRLE